MKKPVIICVDDERIILTSLKAQLKRELGDKYDIETAESGDEAVEIIDELLDEKIEIPVVVSDQIMPGMKGDEFLKYVYEKTRDTHTIMLTGQADVFQVGAAINNANLYRFISKPWDEVDLNMTIKEALSSYSKSKKIESQNEKLEELVDELKIHNENLEKTVYERTKEVVTQNKIIEQKNIDITDSILYAKRIQNAILPPLDHIKDGLKNYFIYYRPRDIVSGDFYWISQKKNKTYLVAADCTGHGVPGAFMSMLGMTMLTEIVNSKEEIHADEVLNSLRIKIIESLHQKTSQRNQPKDGMDLALIILNNDTLELEFAGAYNPAIIIRNKELRILPADKMPIGVHFKDYVPFSSQNFQLEKGDALYLFSDGFSDQFGGERFKKFMIKQFRTLLVEISEKTMDEQYQIIKKTHDDWKGKHEQIDDILVIGLRI